MRTLGLDWLEYDCMYRLGWGQPGTLWHLKDGHLSSSLWCSRCMITDMIIFHIIWQYSYLRPAGVWCLPCVPVQLVSYCDTGWQCWVTLTRSWTGARSQKGAGGKETGRHGDILTCGGMCPVQATMAMFICGGRVEDKWGFVIKNTFYLIKRFEVSFDKIKLSEGIFICLC